MPVRSPEICACITSASDLESANAVCDQVAFYEVRIDLIGDRWPEVAAALPRPWIACNRLASQGGACRVDEIERLNQLFRAVELGAAMVDIEMCAPGVAALVSGARGKARVIVSHHDFRDTGDLESLANTVRQQQNMGADVCKVVTMARSTADVAVVLRLARRFAGQGVVILAMGPLGTASRILAPLVGADFTYASLDSGHESAPGQLTVRTLCDIYESIGVM